MALWEDSSRFRWSSISSRLSFTRPRSCVPETRPGRAARARNDQCRLLDGVLRMLHPRPDARPCTASRHAALLGSGERLCEREYRISSACDGSRSARSRFDASRRRPRYGRDRHSGQRPRRQTQHTALLIDGLLDSRATLARLPGPWFLVPGSWFSVRPSFLVAGLDAHRTEGGTPRASRWSSGSADSPA